MATLTNSMTFFHDFSVSMTIYFLQFPWQLFSPWLSMTVGTLILFHSSPYLCPLLFTPPLLILYPPKPWTRTLLFPRTPLIYQTPFSLNFPTISLILINPRPILLPSCSITPHLVACIPLHQIGTPHLPPTNYHLQCQSIITQKQLPVSS